MAWLEEAARRAKSAAGRELAGVKTEKLRASDACEALIAAAIAVFPEAEESALRGTISGAADQDVHQSSPVLVLGGELPSPMPSWCAWLEHLGALELNEAPYELDNGDVAQRAVLVADKGGHRDARFLIKFRAQRLRLEARDPDAPKTSILTSVPGFLAMYPRFSSNRWSGPCIVRAAVELGSVRIGPPRRPGSPWPQGQVNPEIKHYAAINAWGVSLEQRHAMIDAYNSAPDFPGGDGELWPRAWPTWAFVQYRSQRQEQRGDARDRDRPDAVALYDLRALIGRCTRHAWHGRVLSGSSVGGLECSIAFDFGTTTSCVVEKVTVARAGAHTLGVSFDVGRAESPPPPSGWHTLVGDRERAGAFGCGEQLRLRGGYLATSLLFADRDVVDRFAAPGRADPYSAWLPQQSNARTVEKAERFELRRFKAPELLEYVPAHQSIGRSALAFRSLGRYARLLGEAVAAAHATPSPHDGSAPPLHRLNVALSYPELKWSEDGQLTASGKVYREKIAEIGSAALLPSLRYAWPIVQEASLVAETTAARANRRLFGNEDSDRAPVIVLADFGGLTLHVVVELRGVAGRGLEPDIRGSTMTYKLGGELFLDACALAPIKVWDRARFERYAGFLRERIDEGHTLNELPALAIALEKVIAARIVELTCRQIEATLRRADHAGRYLDAPIAVHLMGQGWLLSGLSSADAERREVVKQIFGERFRRRLSPRVSLEMLDKKDLSSGALSATDGNSGGVMETSENHRALPSLLGVEITEKHGSKRWYSLVGGSEEESIVPISSEDDWWRAFTAGADGVQKPALMHRALWFGEHDPFGVRFVGSTFLRYPAAVSPVAGWVEQCGPSALVLDLLGELGESGTS